MKQLVEKNEVNKYKNYYSNKIKIGKLFLNYAKFLGKYQ